MDKFSEWHEETEGWRQIVMIKKFVQIPCLCHGHRTMGPVKEEEQIFPSALGDTFMFFKTPMNLGVLCTSLLLAVFLLFFCQTFDGEMS